MATNYEGNHLSRLSDIKALAEKVRDGYSTKTEFGVLSDKVDGLVTAGGEANEIEKIKVNGKEQTINKSDKSVDITVPTDAQIEAKVKAGIDDFATKVTSDNATVDTFAELVDYVAKHGAEVTGMLKDIGDNKTNIASLQSELSGKVDKSGDKQLSDENYTTAEKQKLSGIAANATKVEKSANGKIKINGTDTDVYVHPTSGVGAKTKSALYKTTIDANGHITSAEEVEIATDGEVSAMLTEVFGR